MYHIVFGFMRYALLVDYTLSILFLLSNRTQVLFSYSCLLCIALEEKVDSPYSSSGYKWSKNYFILYYWFVKECPCNTIKAIETSLLKEVNPLYKQRQENRENTNVPPAAYFIRTFMEVLEALNTLI